MAEHKIYKKIFIIIILLSLSLILTACQNKDTEKPNELSTDKVIEEPTKEIKEEPTTDDVESSGEQEDKDDENELKLTSYETVNDFEGVTMTVKEGSLLSTGLTVKFENNTDSESIYGSFYILEQMIDGNWYEVPVEFEGEYGFDSIGYNLPSKGISIWDVDWEWLYGSLDPGQYRIIKDVLKFRDVADYDEYDLAAEFNID